MTPPHENPAAQRRDVVREAGELHDAPRQEMHAIPTPAPTPAPRPPRSRKPLLVAGAVALLAALAFGAHAYLTRGEQTTDDAFVEADVVALSSRVGGPVAKVLVEDNAEVKPGQPIVQIDSSDYDVRLAEAQAGLETARAQAAAADAQIMAARATVTRSEAEAAKAEMDLRRAEELRAGGAIASQSYDATKVSSETARAGAGANRAQYSAALANAELAHARVKSAQAALDLAQLQVSWTTVRAPSAGKISRLSARVGQMVQPGQALAQLVPDQTYVVANFKETQMGDIRRGQRVDVEIDAYGGKTLHGIVDSISGGTGARFALLPPDNASGNFVKVVERVPVRVAWEGTPDVPLRAGLSANVTVHTR
jgi:membrane fusion protein (multidrug efflux system)